VVGENLLPNGRIPEVGEMFRQPKPRADDARDRRRREGGVREGARPRGGDPAGRDAFYKGDIARRIADANKARAAYSPTTTSPRTTARIEKPSTTNFHGYDIYKAGPWDQGPVLLQTLNILEGVDLKSAGVNSAEYIHQVHEAIKLAYADRNAYYGDPAFTTGTDDRSALQALRRGAARADWRAGFARAPSGRSVSSSTLA
jgi:gamma-glutamyltranspeptidase/glutathione hydrolase